jgi:membrane-associated protease RseP (regulator of RpoE activity)
VCAFCLLRAFQAMKWPSGADRKDSTGFWGRLSVIVALSLWVVTAAAVRAVTSSSRVVQPVEVASAALARVRERAATPPPEPKRIPRPRLPPAPPPIDVDADNGGPLDAELLAAPRLFEVAGVKTHDPRTLLAFAERLAAAGTDVTILRADLSRAAAWEALASRGGPARITPVHFNGQIAGARVTGLLSGSFPALAGLASGDVITSINGYPISSPERGHAAFQAATRARMAVAEVIRGGRRVVIAVTWPKDRRASR